MNAAARLQHVAAAAAAIDAEQAAAGWPPGEATQAIERLAIAWDMWDDFGIIPHNAQRIAADADSLVYWVQRCKHPAAPYIAQVYRRFFADIQARLEAQAAQVQPTPEPQKVQPMSKTDMLKSFTADAGEQLAEGTKDAAAYGAMQTLFDSLVAMVAPQAPALAVFYSTSAGAAIVRAVGPYLLGAAARMELLPHSDLVEKVALRSIRASTLFVVSPWIERFRAPIVQIFKRAAEDMNLTAD